MIPSEYEQFEQVVSLGVVNFTPVWGDPKQTLAKIEANVVEAAAEGIDIVAFGEEALIGPTGCDACRAEAAACEFHLDLAQTVPGPATDHVVDLAREYDLYVIFGLSERDASDPKVLYNSVAMIGPEGLLGTYHKIHLGALPWVTEGIVFKPGNKLPVFPTRYGPIGVQICYDFWFNPELTRILALKGARLVVNCCATFKGEGKRDYMVHTTTDARAGEPDLHRERQPSRRPWAPGLLRTASRRRARRRLSRAQHHRGARVPAVQSRLCRGR